MKIFLLTVTLILAVSKVYSAESVIVTCSCQHALADGKQKSILFASNSEEMSKTNEFKENARILCARENNNPFVTVKSCSVKLF